MGEFDSLLQGVVHQAQVANRPENGDYYDEEGFLVCGNCHTRRQVEVNMPDLKAVPFDPKKKVRVKMPVSCRCRAEKRKQEEQMLMQDREMKAAESLKRQSLMDERLRGISFDDFQQTKDNAYNLKLCLRYELDRTTLNALAPRAAVLMRKYIDNDDSWTYHRDYAISEVVSKYKEDKDNG